MMQVLILFLTFFSFYHYVAAMNHVSQRFCQVPSLSSQEFNDYVYPLSHPQRTEFDAVTKELLEKPHSEVAKQRLFAFTAQGHIPAFHHLARNAIVTGNMSDAIEFSHEAAVRRKDSSSELALASLYAQSQVGEDEHYVHSRMQAAEYWLRSASVKRVIYDPSLQLVKAYSNDQAKAYLHTLLAERQNEYEALLVSCSDEQLSRSEKDLLNGEITDIPLAGYLIKRHIDKKSGESIKRAVILAEKVLMSASFDPEFLSAANVCTALHSARQIAPSKIATRIDKLLSCWAEKEIRIDEKILIDKPQLAPKRFEVAHYSAKNLSELIAGAETDFEGTDCIDAAIYLNKYRKKDPQIAHAIQTYLNRALQDADPRVRKALIEKGNLEGKYGDSYAAKALDYYADELQSKTGLLHEEVDFMHAQLQKLIKRADKGDDEAAFEVFRLVRNHAPCFPEIPEGKKKELELNYFKKAFQAGNYTAVCCGLPRAQSLNLEKTADLRQAMKFWPIAYRVASRKSDAPTNLPDPQAVAAQAYEKLIEICQVKAPGEKTTDDVEFYYTLVATLADKNSQIALDAIGVVFSKSAEKAHIELFEKTGAKKALEQCIQAGKGWASFALGYYTFVAAINPCPHLTIEQYSLNAIGQLEQARKHLKDALSAADPHLDYSMFSEGDIDSYIGVQYYNLYYLKRAARKDLCQKALHYYQLAADQLNAKGMLEWATITLHGEGERGQSILERAVNYLIKSASLNNAEAFEYLKKMESEGFLYFSRCEGAMTSELLGRIRAFLNERKNQGGALEQEASTNLIDPAVEYYRLKERADQGNIEAMVNVAVMLRDGNGVAASAQKSQEYFTKALLEWDGVTPVANAIAIAYAGLDNNLKAYIARIKVLITSPEMLGSSLVLIPGNAEHNAKVLRNKEVILKSISAAQELMFASNDPTDKELFFSSGLADLIAQRCDCKMEGTFLIALAQRYMQRMRRFPDEIMVAHQQRILFKPLYDVQARLKNSLLHEDFKKNVKAPEVMKSIDDFIRDLSSFIECNPLYKDNFEYLLGIAHLYRSIKNKTSVNEGMAIIKRLAAQGDTQAIYMQGYLALYGNVFNPNHMSADVDAGIRLLETLGRENKHIESLLTLAEYFSVKSSLSQVPKQATKLIKRAESVLMELLKIGQNSDALLSLAEIYLNNPTLKPIVFKDGAINDIVRNNYIHSLLDMVETTNERNRDRINYYKAILCLHNNAVSEQDLKGWQELLLKGANNEDIATLLSLSFANNNLSMVIDSWSNNAECTQTLPNGLPDERRISRTYSIAAWIMTVVARFNMTQKLIGKDEKLQKGIQEATQRANHLLQKALAVKKEYQDPLAHLVKASLILGVEQVGTTDSVALAKRHIIKATLAMNEQQLKICQVPSFKELLIDYLRILAIVEKRPERHHAEAEYVNTIVKQYS